MAERAASPRTGAISAGVYFGCVLAVTAGLVVLLRPSWAYPALEALGLEKRVQATPGSFYAVRVAPLLDEHCAGCHGARRHKGRLRLDSIEAVMRGGKHGVVVKAGSAEQSEMIRRIMLPASDAKAMPPEGRSPLASDEITVLKLWIAAGASGTQSVASIKGAPPPIMKVTIPELDEAAVKAARAPLSAAVERLQARYPGVISYESRGSADLGVNAYLMGAAFKDADLAALAALRDRIVRADLSDTSVTDASAATLAQLKRLQALQLTNTRVTDVTIDALRPLSALRSLNVVGTAASERSLQPLRQNRTITIYDGRT